MQKLDTQLIQMLQNKQQLLDISYQTNLQNLLKFAYILVVFKYPTQYQEQFRKYQLFIIYCQYNYKFSIFIKTQKLTINSQSLIQSFMNRKVSSSLSNLNFKKTFDTLSNIPQLKLPLIRKKLYSQVQKKQNDQLKSHQNSNIQEQYYKTNMESNFKGRISLGKLKLKNQQNFAKEIEEKMKKIIQVTENRLQKNKSQSCMIVTQNQSQIDSEFQQKILQNKELLKKQRQNIKGNQSQKVLVKKNNKNSKKLSLLQHRTNNTKLSLMRQKSKSLFPRNVVVSPKFQNKNLQQNQLQLQTAIQKSNISKIELGSYAKFSVGINTQRQNQIQQEPQTALQQKQLILKDEIKQVQKQEKQNEYKKKVIKVIKIQNKLDVMKKKISERKSKQQNRTKLSFRDQKGKINQHLQKINEQDHQNQRTNSTNLFDSIHEFLSNPHQKSNKSLKFSSRYNPSNIQKNREKLQQKIKQIEQKLVYYHKLQKVQSEETINDMKNNKQDQIQAEQELLKKQSTIIAKLLSETELQSYHQDSSMLSDYGMHWHRYEATNQNERHIIKKSNFEKQLKYIQQLQQKNNENLLKFVQNQKLLHQIRLNKNKIAVQKKFGRQFENKVFVSL